MLIIFNATRSLGLPPPPLRNCKIGMNIRIEYYDNLSSKQKINTYLRLPQNLTPRLIRKTLNPKQRCIADTALDSLSDSLPNSLYCPFIPTCLLLLERIPPGPEMLPEIREEF